KGRTRFVPVLGVDGLSVMELTGDIADPGSLASELAPDGERFYALVAGPPLPAKRHAPPSHVGERAHDRRPVTGRVLVLADRQHPPLLGEGSDSITLQIVAQL